MRSSKLKAASNSREPTTTAQAVLDWWASLPLPDRLAALTTCDAEWCRAVMSMSSQKVKRAAASQSTETVRFVVDPPEAPGKLHGLEDAPLQAKLRSLSHGLNMSARARVTAMPTDALQTSSSSSRAHRDACTLLEQNILVHSGTSAVTVSAALVADTARFISTLRSASSGTFLQHTLAIEAGATVWATTDWLRRLETVSLGDFVASRLEICMVLAFQASRTSSRLSNTAAAAVQATHSSTARIQQHLSSMSTADLQRYLACEWVSAAKTVLQGDRAPIEDALFKSGLLGGWPVRTLSPRDRHWELDWVQGR